jgi:hypothetical protein
VDNKKNKHLVLTVVNGVAKWVDVRDVNERFIGLRHEHLTSRHLVRKESSEHYAEELE